MCNKISADCFVLMILILNASVLGQADNFKAVRGEADFSSKLQDWDGFGVNYVEVPQTLDYNKDPQEYGGLSLLDEDERQKIIEMIFGDEGLKPGVVKMFYDPWHQDKPGGKFNHERTTKWMRYFVKEGLKKARSRGDDLTVITTLYGPPPWATKQKFLRGRDLDPARKKDLANYLISWAKYCREEEGIPLKYISLHNEGEDWHRWPSDGKSGNIGHGHDYNMFWPPEQVVDFMILLRPMMDKAGLEDVGITPGETSNWFRFHAWGYADAIAENKKALDSMALITSHGFYNGSYGRWFGDHRSVGIDTIREKCPDMHAWVTSTSWSKMDCRNLVEMYSNIYSAKVNSITPWACIQRPKKWVGGDPNPGAAFRVYEDGTYEVLRGYYYYKQISRAGQPGMAVAKTMCMSSESVIIAFASNGTKHPDAFTVVNIKGSSGKFAVKVTGTKSKSFKAFQTSDKEDRYKSMGTVQLSKDGVLRFAMPERSAITFFANYN